MRCKGCDRILTELELTMVKADGTPEDLCSICIEEAHKQESETYTFPDVDDYIH